MKSYNLQSALGPALDTAERLLSTVPRDQTVQKGRQAGDLEAWLCEVIYREWHCGISSKNNETEGERDLAELFRVVHAASSRWEEGWKVMNISSRGKVAIRRGPEHRIVHIIDCVNASCKGHPIKVGDTASVVARRDSLTMNPGDWVTFGETWPQNQESLVRLYWNVKSTGAAQLVEEMTKFLDFEFPYFLKCPRKPSEYGRVDSVVLYVPATKYQKVKKQISFIHKAVESTLEDAVPPLVKKLAPGLGLAEDPSKGEESFGTNRCGLIARGITRCLSRRVMDRQAWMGAVVEEFHESGIPLDRPYVNSQKSPEYRFP